MGKIFSTIFGGKGSKGKSQSTSQSQQESYNRAYPEISTALTPVLGEAQNGTNALNALLGGDSTGFNKYKDLTGYNLEESQGLNQILGDTAGRGVLQSGAAGKALQSFGTNLQQQYAKDYIDTLLQKANLGFQAGNTMTGAGGYSFGKSNSQSTSKQSSWDKPGIMSFGKLAQGIGMGFG